MEETAQSPRLPRPPLPTPVDSIAMEHTRTLVRKRRNMFDVYEKKEER